MKKNKNKERPLLKKCLVQIGGQIFTGIILSKMLIFWAFFWNVRQTFNILRGLGPMGRWKSFKGFGAADASKPLKMLNFSAPSVPNPLKYRICWICWISPGGRPFPTPARKNSTYSTVWGVWGQKRAQIQHFKGFGGISAKKFNIFNILRGLGPAARSNSTPNPLKCWISNQRKVSSWTFRGGIPEQESDMWAVLVPQRKNTRIRTKMGEIHELFVFALFLVWFAGATPDPTDPKPLKMLNLSWICWTSSGWCLHSP